VNVVLVKRAFVLAMAKRMSKQNKETVRILVLTCFNIDSQLLRLRALRVTLASPTIH